ncbi:hypothetical protein EUX98_g1902 [Antrodiella citrinella]|uniref:Uncharacterized protein n=1 Tax=Antrodiella citrinella TaxID=2447956 RepID=A0A4S4N376_9APHY|nr:hypothetical protein EUX98_g1902 [Antrodiella citrinella]
MHFVCQASEALSSPTPSVQIPRLKRLYEDLHIVLASLLPHGHAVLVMLSSPLSPTSSPLRSAITHLREILASLKERCAPVRDPIIDAVLEKLEDPPMNELPRIVIETVRDTLKVAETMKEDLSQFVMGNMDEAQLHEIIRGLAQTREHELVISLWGSDEISGIWIKWMATLNETSSIVQLPPPPRRRWVLRLIQSLGQNVTVTCNILVTPSATEGSTRAVPLNELPPSLFLLSPTLLNIQNYLQASVIAATLRSLVRLPPHPQTSKPEMPSPAEDFMQRVWTFLSEEIDQGSGETKLINLADEIVRVRRHISPSTVQEDEEKRLREAVDRTLQPTDPVYQLLQRRLLQAVAERLVAPLSTVPPPAQTVPALHSGRGPRVGTRPLFGGGLLDIYARAPPPKQPEAPMVVKGFEDPVIAAAVTQVVRRLRECIDWAEEVWPEVIVAKE